MSIMWINGIEAGFAEGETLLTVARRMGIPIPTLCYDERVSAAGACRLCLVEISGQDRPVPACSHPAAEGLEVHTETPALADYRRCLLDLVLSENPPGECPQCSRQVPCELHRLAAHYGAASGRLRGATSGSAVADANPFIARNYESCIACYRCTRVCNELEQAHAIAMAGRGFQSRITTLFERGLEATSCTFCGQCVGTCPTGALSDRVRALAADGKEITTSVRSVCPYCGTGCGVLIDVAGDRIVGVRGDRESAVSRGSLCVKGQFGWEFVHSADRLTTPLIRNRGKLEPASWEDALERVRERLATIKEESGPDAVVFWSSSRATNEANYVFQKLARAALGTNNIDNCART
jgi:predicted molibdopterin-dependent oxidoreductase YjgC